MWSKSDQEAKNQSCQGSFEEINSIDLLCVTKRWSTGIYLTKPRNFLTRDIATHR